MIELIPVLAVVGILHDHDGTEYPIDVDYLHTNQASFLNNEYEEYDLVDIWQATLVVVTGFWLFAYNTTKIRAEPAHIHVEPVYLSVPIADPVQQSNLESDDLYPIIFDIQV